MSFTDVLFGMAAFKYLTTESPESVARREQESQKLADEIEEIEQLIEECKQLREEYSKPFDPDRYFFKLKKELAHKKRHPEDFTYDEILELEKEIELCEYVRKLDSK